MMLLRDWHLSTWITGMLRSFLRYGPSVGSLVCGRCGSRIDARVEVGTSSSVYVIDCYPPNSSRYSVAVALTDGGKLSISCVCSPSAAPRSPIDSGEPVGISSTVTSSHSGIERRARLRITRADAIVWPEDERVLYRNKP